MYTTFQAATPSVGNSDGEGSKGMRPPVSRRISTSNACVECRRRKIRCDGAAPCGQCMWYQHPDLCSYSKPTQRVVPSRKLVDRLQLQSDQYGSVFARLFPGKDLATLVSMPREELINLALATPVLATTPASDAEPIAPAPDSLQRSDGADSLDALEQAPDQDPLTDEAKRHRDKVQSISDDVNGLSLSVDRQSSYVGISSITAALKVIFKTAPVARPFIVQSYTETALPSRANTPPPQAHASDPGHLPEAGVGRKLIESYFAYVHVLMPLVDEDQFWHTYLYSERRDSPWLGLLNMVFALGSVSSSAPDSEEHILYYQQARMHLDLEAFGSSSLLVVQALGLMGGYYMHWLSRPNEANSLMGATLRMATALGLHREYNDGRSQTATSVMQSGMEIPADTRRRTWWTLVILDTWAFMTTGRPSLGRLGAAVTVQGPQIPKQMNNAHYQASLRLLPIIHHVTFCKIATKIQDKLAFQPLLKPDDLLALDAELVRWHDDLPPILQAVPEPPSPKQRSGSSQHGPLNPVTPSSATASMRNPFDFSQPPDRDHTACPEVLKAPRAIMHWWYMTLRMLMYRPYLLAVALRKAGFNSMSADERVAVGKCQAIAGDNIRHIVATVREEVISGWASTWLMYQASMVPLVSLFSHLSSPATYAQSNASDRTGSDAGTGGEEDAQKWQAQVELAIQHLDKMQAFCHNAKKTRDVVQRLYDASKHVRQYQEATNIQQQLQRRQQQMQSSPQSFAGMTPGMNNMSSVSVSSSNTFFGVNPMLPNTQLGNNAWGVSPEGDAAISSFWDDMMWDTFPDEPSFNAPAPGMDQADWPPIMNQTDWAFQEQQR
ncbi:hypothetical protein LTR10_012960 [Elasticomyces elasticus]|nr:hypothetical protein LTR10_012960 [Elasticomyces elasticus]KAK4978618.1 hypothetical protein LTR42_001118 [Elasticomyces elasticus]